MSFINCIKKHLDSGKLTKGQFEALENKYNELTKAYEKTGQGAGAASKAAMDLVEREANEKIAKARNLRNHALKVKEINDRLSKGPGTIYNKVSDIYQQAAWRGEGIRATVYSFMDDIADKIKGNFFGLERDHALFEQGWRSAQGEAVENAEAQKIGQVIRQTYDYMLSRYRAAGGIIGKLENYTPQVHRAEAIRKVSKDEWVSFVLERADRNKIIDETTGLPMGIQKLQGMLKSTYDDIVTDGRASLQKELQGGSVPRGGASFEQRRNLSRFIHFKSPDASIEYNAKFGTGENGLTQMFMSSVDSMAKDIGVLETLGPKPDSMSNFLSAKMEADGDSKAKRKWVDAQYRVLTGLGQGDVDKLWYKVLTGAQNWIRASSLGSASISALSDTVFISAAAKVNGLSGSRTLGRYGKLLSGTGGLRKIADRSGYIADVVVGSTLSDTRFAGEMMPGKFTRALASMTNKLSGLHAMTKATQDAISLELNATLADLISNQTPWSKVNPDLKSALNKFQFNEKDWSDLLKADLFEASGNTKFLITNDLRVSNKFEPGHAASLANKIDDLTFSLRQQASNEALLSTRAITTGAVFGDGSPGSFSRAIASTLFMFKTFPITVVLTHTLPAIRRAVSQRKYDHFAQVLIGTTMVGAVPLLLKDLSKGKTIDDPDKVFTPKFLMHSMLQGGGAGLFGDFLFQDRSRFGRNLQSELMGPLVGTTNDILSATKGNLDKFIDGKNTDFLSDTFKVVKKNIPVVGSLWYTRLALERLILDNIERQLDPQFDSKMRKMERKMMEDQGKKFWWRP